MYEEAIAELQKAVKLTGGSQFIRADLGRIYAEMGRQDEARRLLDELMAQAKEHYVSAVDIANIYVGLGESERVFEYLEKAYEEHAVRLAMFIIDPAVDSLRNDPRFQDILRRMGLPMDEPARVSAQEARGEAPTANFLPATSNAKTPK